LKARYWVLITAAAMFLFAAILLDRHMLFSAGIPPTIGTAGFNIQEPVTLQTCGAAQSSSIGPLVPDQNAASSAPSLSVIDPSEKIPTSAWSTRAGFSISSTTDPEYWGSRLGSGWYLDWNIRSNAGEENIEHWSMVRVHEECISPSVEKIQSAAINDPGQVWIIGNEPDVIWQDNTSAAKYAYTYHELYRLIKSSDPTALLAVGGVSQATPLRLQYLDQMLQAYQDLYAEPMPADWWTVHGYVLREEKDSWGVDIPPGIDATEGELREVMDHGRMDLFQNQIRAFRMWMAENGYQNTPLALTEFGILMPAVYGFPSDFVSSYLEQTFTWLYLVKDLSIGYPDDEYHLVQKWAWFSITDPTYSNSDLGDLPSGKLTEVGEKFRHTVSNMEP
jgi:hypothetical protein